MPLLAAAAGFLLVVLSLWDVFLVMVLTRRASRQFQLTTWLVRGGRRLYALLVRVSADRTRRENLLSIEGPALLFLRFGAWALAIISGYALLQWAAGSQIAAPDGSAPFATVLYFSGTTFFTVGLGDMTPQETLPRLLNVLEAASGFLFLGLVISYLPVFYQDYARREIRLAMLDEWAGSPPSAGELMLRLARDHAFASLDAFLANWEEWCAELLESHLSYPILALFRSQHENQSWVAALATILDVCALVLAGVQDVDPRAARLTFAMARHTVVDLGQLLGDPPRGSPAERLRPHELARLRELLGAEGLALREGAAADAKLAELRGLYEPYLHALAEALLMPLPAWLPEDGALDNWQKTARRGPEGHGR